MLDRIKSYFSESACVEHILHLLQTEGATALGAVRTLLAGLRALSGRDMAGVFSAIDAEKADIAEIVAAVKAEFGIS